MKKPPAAILEFTLIGSIMRVAAVDPVTGLEAIIQGPASAGRAALQQAALQKLAYLQKKGLK